MDMIVDMTLTECARCGVSFAFSKTTVNARRQDHDTFYCPFGHGNFYPEKSDVEILRQTLEEKEREIKKLKASEQDRINMLFKKRLARKKKKNNSLIKKGGK